MPYARLKVLVAVSSRELAESFRHFFFKKGAAHIECVSSMYQAADLMLEHDFTLFILDGQLLYSRELHKASVAGVDMVRFIRMCSGEVSEMPVVFLRTSSQQQNILEAQAEIKEARDAGANLIMAQPIDTERLETELERLMKAPKEFIRKPVYIGPCRRQQDVDVGVDRRS